MQNVVLAFQSDSLIDHFAFGP